MHRKMHTLPIHTFASAMMLQKSRLHLPCSIGPYLHTGLYDLGYHFTEGKLLEYLKNAI